MSAFPLITLSALLEGLFKWNTLEVTTFNRHCSEHDISIESFLYPITVGLLEVSLGLIKPRNISTHENALRTRVLEQIWPFINGIQSEWSVLKSHCIRKTTSSLLTRNHTLVELRQSHDLLWFTVNDRYARFSAEAPSCETPCIPNDSLR